jgi:hypothetical protein
MPLRKVKGGYKIKNVKGKPQSKKKALRQLRAIKASQAEAKRKRKGRRKRKK